MPWNNGGPGSGPTNPWGTPGGTPKDGSGKGGQGGDQNPNQKPSGPWGQGNGGRGPGGRGPGGPGQVPDMDELIARAQAFIRGLMPGGGFNGGGGRGKGSWSGGPMAFLTGGRGLALLGIAVVLLWLGSGLYRVQPDEQGVVLRFGAYNRTDLPGLNYHLPWPMESVQRPAVTRINRTEIGFRSGAGDTRIESGRDTSGRDVMAESLMLTGDENIIDIDVAIFWRIRDASAFLFNTRDPQATVRYVAESSMREVIGRTPIQPALTELRASIETDVLKQTQTILDAYGAGVEITQVQLQKVDPPAAVVESFRDVQRANTDAERMRNEAEAYQNDIVPRARGEAARITAEAEGARQASVAEATGQTQRFLSVLSAYQQARQVTMQRMYLETMQEILGHSPTLVIDEKFKGLMPLLGVGDRPGQPAVVPPVMQPTPGPTVRGSTVQGVPQ
jgi:membrane protease subunit HflK